MDTENARKTNNNKNSSVVKFLKSQPGQDKVEKGQANNELLAYEKRRRDSLIRVSRFAVFVSFVLFGFLIFWIWQTKEGTNNAWHTTLILAIAPTTILLFTLKVLSKPEESDDSSTLPQVEILGSAVQIILDFFSKK